MSHRKKFLSSLSRSYFFAFWPTDCPEIQLPKRKLNISVIFKSTRTSFLNEREIFKVLFDTKSSCTYCSKVSPFTSIQNLSPTIPSKVFSNVSFFRASVSCSILSFKSAISLSFVLYTFVLMHLHRKKSRGVKSNELYPIFLPLNFSFSHVPTSLEKWSGTILPKELSYD